MKHPSDEELLKGLLEPTDGAADPGAAAHLAGGCERCDRRIQEFRSVLGALRVGALAEVPEAWTTRALAWLHEQAAGARAEGDSIGGRIRSLADSARRAIEEIRAVVVLDSAAGALLPGVRGLPALSERQIMLESAAGQIHLRVTGTTLGRCDLQGQFLSERPDFDAARDRIVLILEQEEIDLAMSGSGEFRFDGVPSGTIRVRVEGEAYRVTTDPLELTARSDA